MNITLRLFQQDVSAGASVSLDLFGLGVRDNDTDVRAGDWCVGASCSRSGGREQGELLLQAAMADGAALANGDVVRSSNVVGYLLRLLEEMQDPTINPSTVTAPSLRYAAFRVAGDNDFGCLSSCGSACGIRRLRFDPRVSFTLNISDAVLDPISGRARESHQSAWLAAACNRQTGGIDLSYASDARGNTIPDFSHVGYRNGEHQLPVAPTVATAEAVDGEADATSRLQTLIDQVSALPLDPSTGLRGALKLGPGLFRVNGTLLLQASGVVLRGAGCGGNSDTDADATTITTLLSTSRTPGTVLIAVHSPSSGAGARAVLEELPGTRVAIADAYLASGSARVAVANASGFHAGDRVVVERASTAAWIESIGMDNIPDCTAPACQQWSPSSYALKYERRVISVDREHRRLTLDVPLVHPIQQSDGFGGGAVYRVQWSGQGRAARVGIEDLKLDSVYVQGQEDADENHAWKGIELNAVEDAWVLRVACWHFGSNCVDATRSAARATVANSSSYDQVSQITGGRRYSFNVDGALILITGCTTRNGRHDFVTGSRVAGPNVFHNCRATKTHSDIGPHHRYATGLLFDRVVGGDSRVWDRGNAGSGHGWSGAFTLFWNCVASSAFRADGAPAVLNVASPAGALNFGIGTTADRLAGTGLLESIGLPVFPASLYEAQLAARLGTRYAECSAGGGEGDANGVGPSPSSSAEHVTPSPGGEAVRSSGSLVENAIGRRSSLDSAVLVIATTVMMAFFLFSSSPNKK